MPDVTTLRIVWTSNHGEVVSGIRHVENASNNFVNRAGATLVGFLTRDLIRGAMQAIAGLFSVGSAFEDSMNMFQAASQATGIEMDRVGVKARQLGMDLTLPKTSAADAAEAMLELSKAGFGVQTSMDAARAALLLAAAAGTEEAETAEMVANTMNAFNLKGTEAIKVADFLAGASVAASGNLSDMAVALRYASGAAARTGISLEDTVTAIGLMSQKAIQGSLAGTAFRQMLQRLQAPTFKTKALLKELGISAYDAGGNFVGLRSLVEQFSTKLSGLTKQQQDNIIATIFGARAGAAANFVLLAGVKAYDAMSEAIHRTNAAQEIAEARNKGVRGAWDALISRVEDGAIALFMFSNTAMRDFLLGIAEAVPKIIEMGGALIRYIAPTATEVGEALSAVVKMFAKLVELAAPTVAAFAAIAGTAILTTLRGIAAVIEPVANFFRENEVAARALASALLWLAAVQLAPIVYGWLQSFIGLAAYIVWPMSRAFRSLQATIQSFAAASALGISRVTIALGAMRLALATAAPVLAIIAVGAALSNAQQKADNAKQAAAEWVQAIVTRAPDAAGQLREVEKAIAAVADGQKRNRSDLMQAIGDEKRMKELVATRSALQIQIAQDEARASEDQRRAYLMLVETAGQGVADMAAAAGANAQTMDEMAKAVQKFEADVTKSFNAATSVVEAFGDDAEVTAAKVMKFFEDQVKAAREWSENLKKLAKAGVDEGLIAELATAGPKAAPLVKALLDAVSEGNLDAINQARADLDEILQDTLNTLTGKKDPFNTTGGVLGDAFADGLKGSQGQARGAADVLGSAFVGQVSLWEARSRDYGYSLGTSVVSGINAAVNQMGGGRIPLYAAGGIVRKPTLAWVGEKAPEVILPMDDPNRAMDLLQQSGMIDLLTPKQKSGLIPTEMRTTGGGNQYVSSGVTVINVYNRGSVIAQRDLEESIRSGLIENGNRRGGVSSYLAVRN